PFAVWALFRPWIPEALLPGRFDTRPLSVDWSLASSLLVVSEMEVFVPRWEHLQLRVDAIGTGGAVWSWRAWMDGEVSDLSKTLRRYEAEGWELVAAVGDSSDHVMYFKRPVM